MKTPAILRDTIETISTHASVTESEEPVSFALFFREGSEAYGAVSVGRRQPEGLTDEQWRKQLREEKVQALPTACSDIVQLLMHNLKEALGVSTGQAAGILLASVEDARALIENQEHMEMRTLHQLMAHAGTTGADA